MKKINTAAFAAAALLLSGAGYSQTVPHSGIIRTISASEQLNVIKIHCDELADATLQDVILAEYAKYSDRIASVEVDPATLKIYIKYHNTIDANMLLGILDRVNITAFYYDTQNNAVLYAKAGNEQFRR